MFLQQDDKQELNETTQEQPNVRIRMESISRMNESFKGQPSSPSSDGNVLDSPNLSPTSIVHDEQSKMQIQYSVRKPSIFSSQNLTESNQKVQAVVTTQMFEAKINNLNQQKKYEDYKKDLSDGDIRINLGSSSENDDTPASEEEHLQNTAIGLSKKVPGQETNPVLKIGTRLLTMNSKQ